MSAEIGLQAARLKKSCLLTPCRELNSLCKMDTSSGNHVLLSLPRECKDVLAELHEAHPGMVCMKTLARMFVWWPGIDADVEGTVQLCQHCQANQSSPPVSPLHPWQWPSQPWTRLHIDYAGLLCSIMILVIGDVHSKWIEALPVPSAMSSATIGKLRTLLRS